MTTMYTIICKDGPEKDWVLWGQDCVSLETYRTFHFDKSQAERYLEILKRGGLVEYEILELGDVIYEDAE